MQAVPQPDTAELRANETFEALLWALSRPGLPRALPDPAEPSIVDALLDRECRVFSADPLLVPQIMRTGAEIAELEQADHVFLGDVQDADVLTQLRQGSDLYPDDGATVVLRCALRGGAKLALSGPGVDGRILVSPKGLPDGFWQMRAQVMRYPMGFDLLLVDGQQVVGIPRSTQVEVL